MDGITISNGRVLLENGTIDRVPVRIEGGTIAGFTEGSDSRTSIDCAGALVLPGIVDLHGDSFEWHVMPRPRVQFPLDIGLLDNDRALAVNGITTAFLGVAFSWEPGARGGKSAAATIAHMADLRGRLGVDTRLHLRFETFNIDGAAGAVSLIEAGVVDLLAFNDHLGQYERWVEAGRDRLEPWARQTGLSVPEFIALLRRTRAREAEVPATVQGVAQAARAAAVPLASHDDETPAVREAWQSLGVTIADFPCSRETARRARALDNPVVMGAPNVLRGGSQDGNVSAGEMVAEGYCTVLASDYYYPSLLHAVFRLVGERILPLPHAWALVSANPASAIGLSDRGLIGAGRRADLVIVDDRGPGPARVAAAIAAGRVIFVGDGLSVRHDASRCGSGPSRHPPRPAVEVASALDNPA